MGDFNGDGRTDFIASPTPDATWTGWRLFLADSNGNRFTYSGTGSLPADFKEIIPGDFNGDGNTDILRQEYIRSYGYWSIWRSTGTSLFDIGIDKKVNQDGSVLTFENDQSNLNDNSSLSDSLVPSNGDIAVASVTYQNYFVYYGTGNGFIAGPSVTTESRPHGVRVADFNGDGAMDLFVYYTSKSAGLHDFKICMSGFSAGNLIAFNTIKSGFIYKISAVLMNSTDNMLISSIVGTIWVGLLSNYVTLCTSVASFVVIIFNNLTASIGNLVATESKEKRLQIFEVMSMMSNWIAFVCFICTLILCNDFIRLWLGGKYVLEQSIVLPKVMMLYVSCVMQPIFS